MPVTRSRTYLADIGLEDSNNTTGFLFGDEDSIPAETRTTPTAQVGNTDAFSSLYRQQAYPSMVSLPAFPLFLACLCAARALFGCLSALSFPFPPSGVLFQFLPFLQVSETWLLHQISVFRRLVPAGKHAPPHVQHSTLTPAFHYSTVHPHANSITNHHDLPFLDS